jgi:hypothetical protein
VISGLAKVGGTLSATPGTWSIPGVTTTYQWKVDGAALAGATASTLKLAPAQQGHKISVTVSASRTGYPAASLTTPSTAAVLPGVLSNPVKPTLTGTAQVGLPLAATLGTWSPAPTSVTGQWLADGVPVAGATSTSWTPTWRMVGKTLTFRVTAARTGYTPVTATVAATAPVRPGQMTVTSPATMSGTAAVGQTLRVDPGAASKAATASIQWLRGNRPVPGATTSSYPVTNADLGTRLTAQVTWNRNGYTPVVARTGSTDRIRTAPVFRVRATPGRGKVAMTVTVSASGVRPVGGRVRISYRGQEMKLLPLKNGTAVTTVRGLQPGKQVLTVRYLGGARVFSGSVPQAVTIR